MLIPVFSLQLNNKVFPRTFAVGKFNGKRSCLVGATAGNKVEIIFSISNSMITIVFKGFYTFSRENKFTITKIRRKCFSSQCESSGNKFSLWTT